MRVIELTQGRVTVLDDEDYDRFAQYRWCLSHGYAVRRVNGKLIYLHREILNLPQGLYADHRNGDKLDNRRSNLRSCTIAENSRNAKAKNPNKLKGAFFDSSIPSPRPWRAGIMVNRHQIWLGRFETEQEAHEAYCKAAQEHHGEFSRTN